MAAFLLWGCTAREIVVSRPADLELKIEEVTGTKVVFSVTSSNENACYTYFTMSGEHPDFSLSERDAAEEFLRYLEETWEGGREKEDESFSQPEGRFSDFALFRGSRTLKQAFLSSGTDFKLLLFQVNPKTHEIIGEIHSEQFRTRDVTMTPLEFSFYVENRTLFIVPSDPERTYFWATDREARILDNYDSAYEYLYSLIDMYENYGFVERMLSKGTVKVEFDRDQLWEGATYWATAIGYADGEINSTEGIGLFVSRAGYLMEDQH